MSEVGEKERCIIVVGRRRRERGQVVEADGGRQRADMTVVVDGLRNHGGSNG